MMCSRLNARVAHTQAPSTDNTTTGIRCKTAMNTRMNVKATASTAASESAIEPGDFVLDSRPAGGGEPVHAGIGGRKAGVFCAHGNSSALDGGKRRSLPRFAQRRGGQPRPNEGGRRCARGRRLHEGQTVLQPVDRAGHQQQRIGRDDLLKSQGLRGGQKPASAATVSWASQSENSAGAPPVAAWAAARSRSQSGNSRVKRCLEQFAPQRIARGGVAHHHHLIESRIAPQFDGKARRGPGRRGPTVSNGQREQHRARLRLAGDRADQGQLRRLLVDGDQVQARRWKSCGHSPIRTKPEAPQQCRDGEHAPAEKLTAAEVHSA